MYITPYFHALVSVSKSLIPPCCIILLHTSIVSSLSGYILDLLEGGRKLIVFGHHKAVLDAISASLDSKVIILYLPWLVYLMPS